MIEDRGHHLILCWLSKSTRAGHFPEAYACLWADLPASKAYLMEIGSELEAIMKRRDGRSKSSRLGRLGVKVSKQLGLNGGETGDPLLTDFAPGFFQYARDHDGNRFSPDRELMAACGYLIVTVTIAIALGLPLDPEPLAEVAIHHMLKDGHSLSITDVRRALRGLTQQGPLADWIRQEDVARLRVVFSRQKA